MKQLLLCVFVFLTFSMYAKHENLKQAIIKSNIAQVKEILKTTKLSKEEISSLSGMAQNIVKRRRENEKIAYIPEVILALSGIILNCVSLVPICGGSCDLLEQYINKKTIRIKKEYIAIFSFGGLVNILSLSILYGSYKIFKITNQWHYDAFEIKQLIESQEIKNTESLI